MLSKPEPSRHRRSRSVTSTPAGTQLSPGQEVRVAIIGSGFAGLGLAVRLRQQGETDFVVLERGDDVGGTWRDNTYPGAACDVQSNLYSFSFAPNPDWPRTYSAQPEIQAYLRSTAERFGVRPHCVFGAEVTSARWDHAARRWRVRTTAGDVSARVLVSAAGFLADRVTPTSRGWTPSPARWCTPPAGTPGTTSPV